MVAALMARTQSRSALPSCNRPCCSSAGSKVGIITLSRLPHTRSDASHSAVSTSLVVAPYLRLRSRAATNSPVATVLRCPSARTACLRCQPVVAHSSSRMRPFSACVADRYRSATADTTSRRAPMLMRPAIDDTDPIR